MNEQCRRTLQYKVGVDKIFKGFIIKDWFGENEYAKYRKWNKVLIKQSIEFYQKYWTERNEAYYQPEK